MNKIEITEYLINLLTEKTNRNVRVSINLTTMVNDHKKRKRMHQINRKLGKYSTALRLCECDTFSLTFSRHLPPKVKNLLAEYYTFHNNAQCTHADNTYVPLIFSIETDRQVTLHSVVPSTISLSKKWFRFFLSSYETNHNTKTTKTTKKMRVQLSMNLQEIKRHKLQITENNQRIFLLQNEKGEDGKTWVKKVDAYSEETVSKVKQLQNNNDEINAMIKNIEQSVT